MPELIELISLVLPRPFTERKGLVTLDTLFFSKQQKFATESLHSLITGYYNQEK